MFSRLRRLLFERRGNFSTMTALAFPVMVLGVGLTLDSATLYVQKRDLQGTADIAAITAAANIDKAAQAAALTLTDNGYQGVQTVNATQLAALQASHSLTNTLLVQPGRYTADGTKTLAQRFVAGATPTNAVKVSVRTKGETYFPETVFSDTMVAASAIALITPEASFQVGSRLASLNTNDSVLLNAILGGMLGTKLNLSLMDYNALLSTKVDAFKFLDALASELNVTAGSYQQILNTQANIGQVLRATAAVSGLDLNTKNTVGKIVTALPVTKNAVPLNKLLGLGKAGAAPIGSSPYGAASNGLAPQVGLLDLIQASIGLSNGSKQISTGLGIDLSPLANVTLDLAVGEPPQSSPWLKMGEVGSVVYTAQTRLKLSLSVGSINRGSQLFPDWRLINIPIYLNLAAARAELTSLSCNGNDISTVKATIRATPAIADLRIADVNPAQMANFNSTPAYPPAQLLNLLALVTVTVAAQATITNVDASTGDLTFNYTDLKNRTVKQVSTKNYTQSLASSLLKTLDIQVGLLNLISIGVKGEILSEISKALTPIDTLLSGILGALGIKLGSADVWMTGATCGKAVLVQ